MLRDSLPRCGLSAWGGGGSLIHQYTIDINNRNIDNSLRGAIRNIHTIHCGDQLASFLLL
jgi:hypothetical protein